LIGSAYRVHSLGTPILPAIDPTSNDNATWLAQFGNVTLPGALDLDWSGINRVTPPALPVGERLQISAVSRTGAVRGSYSNRATGARISFNGVAFQKQEVISGMFLGKGATGRLTIQPADLPTLTVTDLTAAAGVSDGDTADLGNAGINGGIAERNFEITNTGGGALWISDLSIEDGKPFAIVSSTKSVIPVGGKAIVKVRFQPTAVQTDTAEITISSNDAANNPFTFTVQGTGEAGSNDGSRPTQDFWAGDSPVNQAAPFTTAAIVGGAYNELAHGGSFEGFVRQDAPGDPLVGLMTLRVTRSNFSGTATVDGRRHSIRGSFDVNGTANGVSSRGTAFTLAVHVVTDGSGGVKIIGTFGDDEVELVQGAFNRLTNPSPFAGTFTMLLPLNEDLGAGFPGGDGYGPVSITTDGRIRALLVLGDGTRVTQTGLVSEDGEWLFYKAVYRTGMLAGSLIFGEIFDVSDFNGLLQWLKPANSRDRLYPNGFQIQQTAVGAVYDKPDRGEFAMDSLTVATDNLAVFLTGGGVENLPAVIPATWAKTNRVTYVKSAREAFSFVVTSKTGAVRGSFSDPVTKVRVSFGGVIYQKQNLISGAFVGKGETGRLAAQAQQLLVVAERLMAAPPTTGAGYEVETVTIANGNIEHRLKRHGHHFGSVFVDQTNRNGTWVFRPHPGVDPNGWGSSLHLQPFLPNATLTGSQVDSVTPTAGTNIVVDSSGHVANGPTGSFGTWNSSLTFTYDPVMKKVAATGSYNINLPGVLATAPSSSKELNLYKLASNRLENVPLLDGTTGNTGDTSALTHQRDGGTVVPWNFVSTFPQDIADVLIVDSIGGYYNVDTIAQGINSTGIKPAYKPGLKVTLTNTAAGGVEMIFGAIYVEKESQLFFKDNIAITPLILANSPRTVFTYNVAIESVAPANDGAGKEFDLRKPSNRAISNVYHDTNAANSFNALIGELLPNGFGQVEGTVSVPFDELDTTNLFKTR
jgi:hypothetical protein